MSLKPHTSILGLCAALALFPACNKADDVANQVDEKVTELNVNDQWAAACGNVPLDIFGLSSQIEEYDIGASISRTTTLFHEDNCATPVIRVTENGSYEVGDKVPGDSYVFNVQYNSVSITPVNEDGKNILNTVQACGINDWAVGQTRDVTTASSDDPVLARCWTKTPRQIFDIVQVSGDQLKFGLVKDGKDKTSQEKRPTETDQTNILVRK